MEYVGNVSFSNYGVVFNNDNPETISIQGTSRYVREFTITCYYRETFNVNYNEEYIGYSYISFNVNGQIGFNQNANIFGISLVDVIKPEDFEIDLYPASYTADASPTISFGNIGITHYFTPDHKFNSPNDVRITLRYRIYYYTSNILNEVLIRGNPSSMMASSLYSCKNDKLTLLDIKELLMSVNFDSLVHDYSGIPEYIDSEVASAAAIESAADQAISSALPYADNELNDILQYDYTSIGTDSLTALSFWKSLGDYILSNSNLVGIGALLVACLFLGFVIYLLRL